MKGICFVLLFVVLFVGLAADNTLFAQTPAAATVTPASSTTAATSIPDRKWLKAVFVKEGYGINDDTFDEVDQKTMLTGISQEKFLGKNAIEDLKKGKYLVRIIGYACDIQPNDLTSRRRGITNTGIALQRALRVKEYLEALGVDDSLINWDGAPSLPGQKGEKFRRVKVYFYENVDAANFVTRDEFEKSLSEPRTGLVDATDFATRDEFDALKGNVRELGPRIRNLENAFSLSLAGKPFVKSISVGAEYHHTFSDPAQLGADPYLLFDLRLTDSWSLQPFAGVGYGQVRGLKDGDGLAYTLGIRNVIAQGDSAWYWYFPGIRYDAYNPQELLLEKTKGRSVLVTGGGGLCFDWVCLDLNLGIGGAIDAKERDTHFAFSLMPSVRFFYSFKNGSHKEEE